MRCHMDGTADVASADCVEWLMAIRSPFSSSSSYPISPSKGLTAAPASPGGAVTLAAGGSAAAAALEALSGVLRSRTGRRPPPPVQRLPILFASLSWAEGATNSQIESGAGEEYCLFVFPQGGGLPRASLGGGEAPLHPLMSDVITEIPRVGRERSVRMWAPLSPTPAA